MYKCKYCKPASLIGYYRCGITNVMRRNKCIECSHPACKHFKVNAWHQFLNWLDNLFD